MLPTAGFMVIRDGELVFMSPQQQHEFNFPYQIGSPDSMSDTPQVRTAGWDVLNYCGWGVWQQLVLGSRWEAAVLGCKE